MFNAFHDVEIEFWGVVVVVVMESLYPMWDFELIDVWRFGILLSGRGLVVWNFLWSLV